MSPSDKPAFSRLESERLVVRRFAEGDLADFLAYAREQPHNSLKSVTG